LGNGDRFAARYRFDWRARGDEPEQRQLDSTAAHARRYELDRSTAVPGAADESLLLQVGEMFVNRRERGEAESPADFFQTRSVPVLLNELVEVVEDFALAFRQR